MCYILMLFPYLVVDRSWLATTEGQRGKVTPSLACYVCLGCVYTTVINWNPNDITAMGNIPTTAIFYFTYTRDAVKQASSRRLPASAILFHERKLKQSTTGGFFIERQSVFPLKLEVCGFHPASYETRT